MAFRPLRLLALAALIVWAWAPAPAANALQPKLSAARSVSLAGLLNGDGTLRLDGQFNGSLDLKGWNVQLDPIH